MAVAQAGWGSSPDMLPLRGQVTTLWTPFFICEMWRMTMCRWGKKNYRKLKAQLDLFFLPRGCHFTPKKYLVYGRSILFLIEEGDQTQVILPLNWVRLPHLVGGTHPLLLRMGRTSLILCPKRRPPASSSRHRAAPSRMANLGWVNVSVKAPNHWDGWIRQHRLHAEQCYQVSQFETEKIKNICGKNKELEDKTQTWLPRLYFKPPTSHPYSQGSQNGISLLPPTLPLLRSRPWPFLILSSFQKFCHQPCSFSPLYPG